MEHAKEIESVDSHIHNLESIADRGYFFNIPIYQRLYVWREAQVKTLLEDLYTAYEEKKPSFYLGGVLVVKDEHHNLYDLIDGQQRFTTLWLLSLCLGESLDNFMRDGEKNRIGFAIRDNVTKFFKSQIHNADHQTDKETRELDSIKDALGLISDFIKEKFKGDKDSRGRFATYIYKKVRLVITAVPKSMNLNKLFEVINSRGLQLNHHQILKAKLLELIDRDDRLKYSQLWNACSEMSDYLEKNIREEAGLRIQDFFENEQNERLSDPKEMIQAVADQTVSQTKSSLLEILETSNIELLSHEQEENGYEADRVRSIISFPLLLQHCLRIFLFRNRSPDLSRIAEKELLLIFDEYFFQPLEDHSEAKREKQARDFIELLWKVRYEFDKHIVKWIDVEKEEVLQIRKLRKNDYLQRVPNEKQDGFDLLQMLLYHSQQMTTHYWLTPLLLQCLQNSDHGHLSTYLQEMDNRLFCSGYHDKLIERTLKEMENLLEFHGTTYILEENEGTAFPHYWFYKLEFILWCFREDFAPEDRLKLWEEFRITAKNSIEHISPQHPHEADQFVVSSEYRDGFGNLALVSRSINSEYSNLPFREKRERFITRNREQVDSLKLDVVYQENETWNDEPARKHLAFVINSFTKYFNQTMN